jgi:hypothetical protein
MKLKNKRKNQKSIATLILLKFNIKFYDEKKNQINQLMF